MIVFTIAYGEAYIRKAIDFCLPSLASPGNIPSITSAAPELHVLTVARDLALFKGLLQQRRDVTEAFSGRVIFHDIDVDFDSEAGQSLKFRNDLGRYFLCHAANLCLRADKSFMFAVPDLVYSDGCIAAALQLHRLTGKVISIFNGRVQPTEGEPYSAALMDRLLQPHGVRDYFFSNMSSNWQSWTTDDPEVIPSPTRAGHVIFHDQERTYIFSRPNPLLGRFTRRDLMFYAERGSVGAWDHEWQDLLLREGRLLVQTNLDIGMSVELDSEGHDPVPRNHLVEQFGGAAPDAQRENKFSWPYAYMPFTTIAR